VGGGGVEGGGGGGGGEGGGGGGGGGGGVMRVASLQPLYIPLHTPYTIYLHQHSASHTATHCNTLQHKADVNLSSTYFDPLQSLKFPYLFSYT